MRVGNYTIGKDYLLIKAISGSKAYGLSTPQSDTDIKGVFVLPKREYYGLKYTEQVSDANNDIVFYELKRFFELLQKNNPNIIELLATPKNCILYKHPLFETIDSSKILSKLCQQTFVLYAEAQLKKAKGLNKKIVNPISKERKTIVDFCYVVEGAQTKPLNIWLKDYDFKQENCGLISLAHMKDIYAIFHESQAKNLLLKGIYSGADANDVQLSSVPKNIEPLAIINFNKDGYSVYCKEYKEYWSWVEKRNKSRYQNTIEKAKNYDTKNMMHVFRLLNMAEDIAIEGEIIVLRPEREFLLKVKNGDFTYEYLLDNASAKIERVNNLFKKSKLLEKPDLKYINSLLIQVREEFYKNTYSSH